MSEVSFEYGDSRLEEFYKRTAGTLIDYQLTGVELQELLPEFGLPNDTVIFSLMINDAGQEILMKSGVEVEWEFDPSIRDFVYRNKREISIDGEVAQFQNNLESIIFEKKNKQDQPQKNRWNRRMHLRRSDRSSNSTKKSRWG